MIAASSNGDYSTGSMTNQVLRLRAVLLASLFFCAALPIFGHAVLLKSTPEANSLTAGPAITVELTFNSRVNGKLSHISLVTPDGKVYPLTVQAQRAPEVLTAPAKDLIAGKYRIRWQVLASDGHITRGEVPIVIK